MTAGNRDASNDRLFCWEQVSRINRLFRISRVFASHKFTGRLLPLYALFAAIEQISSTSSDENLASSKLSWWRNELHPQNLAASQHPLVKELRRTGAAAQLPGDAVAGLLDGALRRLSAPAPADMEALRKTCLEVNGPQLELELALLEMRDAAAVFDPGLSARSGLVQLLRESARRTEPGSYWWIPLNRLARHRTSREEIKTSPKSPNVVSLMREVAAEGLCWGGDFRKPDAGSAVDYSPLRHLIAVDGIYSRKLKCLAASTPDRFTAELERLGPFDLLAAWKRARSLG